MPDTAECAWRPHVHEAFLIVVVVIGHGIVPGSVSISLAGRCDNLRRCNFVTVT